MNLHAVLILRVMSLALIQASLRLKQTKKFFFFSWNSNRKSLQRFLKTQGRKERKMHALKMLCDEIIKGFPPHIPVRSRLT